MGITNQYGSRDLRDIVWVVVLSFLTHITDHQSLYLGLFLLKCDNLNDLLPTGLLFSRVVKIY